MNVTNIDGKSRKLNKGYLQKVPSEKREYAKVLSQYRITENNFAVMNFGDKQLLEKILHRDNMNNAYFKVKSNRGVGGVDKMQVDELLPYLRNNKEELLKQLLEGKYKPNPVRRVEIPKEDKGKVRKLGIPTVVDRVIQQSIAQILTPIYEMQFSRFSYGFRPGIGAHNALKQCQENADEGYVYVVDMDLEKFFDTVCQSKLIEILSRTIKDGRVISLIYKYMNAGVIQNRVFARTEVGVPQGGPLSPLLGNIMLNELDKELALRGHRFVRYADDCMIFCKSKRSAQRTLENIIPFIERKLFLKVNKEKTKVAHISKVKYLGYTFYRYNKKCRFRVHPKSIDKMKKRLREITCRNDATSNEVRKQRLAQFIKGWLQYFKLADMRSMLTHIDEWLRRRIRAIYWKQWKRVKTRYKELRRLGNLQEWQIHELANCRKGIWRASLILNSVLTKKGIISRGYITMTDYYLQIHEN